MISFKLSEGQEIVRDAMGDFAGEAIRPLARECDETESLPDAFLQQVWELGLTSTQIPEVYGGGGEERSPVTNALVLEELARRIEEIRAREQSARELGIRVRRENLDLDMVYATLATAQFKGGNFEFDAQASGVAVTAGISFDASYEHGVAIFTMAKGGLMYEASIGGQKFSFAPK